MGEAGSGDEAIAVVRRTRPDVVLMDVRMPGRDGLSATAELDGGRPRRTRVLVLTTFDHDEYLYGALRAGAAGFLLKNSTPEELVRGGAARRRRRVGARPGGHRAGSSPGFTSRPGPDAACDRRLAGSPSASSTCWRCCARGLTNTEIAGALGVGEATAKTHVSHVLMKLGVRDRVQAVIFAFESGFAPSDRRVGGIDEPPG